MSLYKRISTSTQSEKALPVEVQETGTLESQLNSSLSSGDVTYILPIVGTGLIVGIADIVGLADGISVGTKLGMGVGTKLGRRVGCGDGESVGARVGRRLGI